MWLLILDLFGVLSGSNLCVDVVPYMMMGIAFLLLLSTLMAVRSKALVMSHTVVNGVMVMFAAVALFFLMPVVAQPWTHLFATASFKVTMSIVAFLLSCIVCYSIYKVSRSREKYDLHDEQYQSYISGVLDLMAFVTRINARGVVTYVSSYGASRMGYSPEELVGQNYDALFYPKRGDGDFWQHMADAYSIGNPYRSEVRTKAKDGTSYWLDTYIFPVFDDRHVLREYLSIQYDITEEKKFRDELLDRQRITSLAIDAGEIGVWEWNVESNDFVCNEYMYKHYGWTADQENITSKDFVARVHPEDMQKLVRVRDNVLAGLANYENNYRIIVNNDIRHISSKGILLRDENGQPTKIIGVSLNLTDVVKVENELQKKQQLINLAIEASEIGVWSWNMKMPSSELNEYMYKHFDYPLEDLKSDLHNFLKIVHPEDREKLVLAMEESARNKTKYDAEYRIFCRDGSVRHIATKGVFFYDADDTPLEMVGTCLNITRQKHIEEELRTQQELLTLAIDAGNVGIFNWNIKEDILYGNKYFNAHYGFSENQTSITFSRILGIIHPDDIRKVQELVGNDFNNQTRFDMQYRVILPSGAVHHISTSGIIFRGDSRAVERVVGVVFDVTKQKQLEETLRESEERFKSAITHSAIGMALVGIDGRWLKINNALCDILGYGVEELLQSDFQSITHPDDLAADLLYIGELIEGRVKSGQMEKRYLHKSGHIIWAQLNGSVVRDAQNNPLYFIVQIQDISSRRRNEEEILKMNVQLHENGERLQRLNSELESFSYSVSHDLRAPLRIIDGYVNILNEEYAGRLDENAKMIIQTIVENVSRMGVLINDLLEFSRMNRKEIAKSILDKETLHEVINHIIADLRQLEGDRHLDIRIGDLEEVLVDVQMFRQVWVNLISNAMKYTKLTPHTVIEIGSSREDQHVCFFIKDNGIGFNMKYADRLFNVFQRLHSQKHFEGTGVGLALVKRIVERHGGRIWVQAKENEGATFYFTIPN